MENFNIMWVHWKIHFLGGGGEGGSQKKTIYRVELPKRGLRKFADLRGRLGKKEGNALYVD